MHVYIIRLTEKRFIKTDLPISKVRNQTCWFSLVRVRRIICSTPFLFTNSQNSSIEFGCGTADVKNVHLYKQLKSDFIVNLHTQIHVGTNYNVVSF